MIPVTTRPRLPQWHPGPAYRMSDWISRRGAEQLRDEIQHLWHSHGWPSVRVWVEPTAVFPHRAQETNVFCVRTNLVAGLPPELIPQESQP